MSAANGKTNGTGHGEKLSRLQERAIIALLHEPTLRCAADEAGVSEKTLQRWLQDERFRAAFRAARSEVLERAVGRLLRLCEGATSALGRALRCGKTSDEVKAAVAILGQAVKGVEVLDLAARVEVLEELLREKGYIQ